ncbi:MAG TPA: Gldg family protein, partial [Gammaproteobacteria bacterium]
MQKRALFSGTGLLLGAALALSVIILANAVVTGVRIDLTENRLFTLSEGTRNILEALDEPIRLDFYFSRETLADYPLIVNYATRVRDLLEAYESKSGGKVRLTIIEPEPFSEEEDQAVASGLEGVAVNSAGDRGYFGLVGTNATDDTATIPFFQETREGALEYDLTKLIYNLAHPEKRVVGIVSGLPLFGSGMPPARSPAWAITDSLREFFDIRDLGPAPQRIDDDIDVLMVVHPKDPDPKTLFAIDQYLLSGRRALVFVDPLAESDPGQPDPENPYVLPDMDSDLKFLFEKWGVKILEEKIAGDINSAMRVQSRGARGPQETNYLPWLRLGRESFNHEDFTTSELEVVHMGTAGIIEKRDDSKLTLTPLIQTSPLAAPLERDLILFQRDPNVMLQNFQPGNKQLVLAAKLEGKVGTAFPDGPPEGAGKAEFLREGDVSLILVADTDILSDMFWIRTQSFFGIDIPQAIANNGDFVINAAEILSGSSDLVSLRSRGEFSRPFEVVEDIRREAEQQFREQERALQAKLEETEQKIKALQTEGGEGGLILTPEQAAEIEVFRQEQIKTRKELRAVQHELQKNIERLGTQL